MRRLPIAALTLALALAAGCGGGSSKVAGTPTADEIRKVEEADRQVEVEERGTPIKGKGRR
jgi:hypothetical protein